MEDEEKFRKKSYFVWILTKLTFVSLVDFDASKAGWGREEGKHLHLVSSFCIDINFSVLAGDKC